MIESKKDDNFFSDAEIAAAKNHGLFVLRGCTRNVLLGSKSDVEALLPEISTPHTSYSAENAYAHLLRYVTGQFSKTRGESQIVDQFKKSWNEFSIQTPEKAKSLHYLYDSIIADNRTVRTHATAELRPAFYETTAHDLSGQKGGEDVLLVAGENNARNGYSTVTRNLVKQLVNNRKNAVGTLYITHPDPEMLKSMMTQMQKDSIISKHLPTPIPFEEAFANSAQRKPRLTFVTLKMDQYPEADTTMLRFCDEHEAFRMRLVHLGGNTKPDRITRGVWKDHTMELAIMPEAITATQNAAQTRNKQIVDGVGLYAANNCALSRLSGKNPITNIITKPTDEYLRGSGIIRTGRRID